MSTAVAGVVLHKVEQRSPQWDLLRSPLLTSTGACCIWSGWDVKEGRKKGSESTQRRDLRLSLCCARLTGQPQEEPFTRPSYMERGIEKETEAFDAYEAFSGRLVRRIGFVSRDDLAIGCSPDGLIGNIEGGCELKCPKTATHLGYIRDAQQYGPLWFPEDYIPQLRHHLYVTGADWWDFVSYDDRLPDGLRLFVRRMSREQALLPAYDVELRKFLGEVEREERSLRSLAEAA